MFIVIPGISLNRRSLNRDSTVLLSKAFQKTHYLINLYIVIEIGVLPQQFTFQQLHSKTRKMEQYYPTILV